MSGDRGLILPVRLIVSDGDDLTFVCKADWGVPLAALFLRNLLNQKDQPFPLTACAGIALVHNHFPLYSAYEIAESCCKNAKKKWYASQDKDSLCCLDYQLVRGTHIRDFDEMRQSHYAFGSSLEKLSRRPYTVTCQKNMICDDMFDKLDSALSQMGKEADADSPDTWPRTRLKHLYQAMRGDEGKKELLKQEYLSRGFDIEEISFDVLELMEYYDISIFQGYAYTEEGCR